MLRLHQPGASQNLLEGAVTARDVITRPASFLERARALRAIILPGKEGRAARTPGWLRQMAAVAVGGVPARRPLVQHWAPEAPLQRGALLLATTPRKGRAKERHCEDQLIDRLRAEEPDDLAELAPLTMYSTYCPCPACSSIIAKFAAERPELQLEVVYDRQFLSASRENHGDFKSDRTSIAEMRAAGVDVGRVETLWEAAEDVARSAEGPGAAGGAEAQ